jgi:hypothetical protein
VKIGSLASVRMFVEISGATGSGQLKIGGFPSHKFGAEE